MVTNRMVRATIATICLIALFAGSASALQGTPEADPASPEASPVSTDATPVAEENQNFFDDEYRPFSDLGFRDRSVVSNQGVIEYFLPIPPGVVPVNYSALDLSISHSPLLQPELSTMTVFANGVAISSVFLDESNQDGGSLDVELPTEGFTGDAFHIQIRFSLRLSTESCEPADNQGLWATVHADSTYYFSLIHTAGTADLATLDRQFTNVLEPVSIVIPENPSSAELDAAGRIAFEIGRRNGNSAAPPAIVRVSAGSTVTAPAILVGTGASLNDRRDWSGLSWNGSAFQTDDGAVPADYGVIALTQDPRPILLVSGATDAALLKAASALGDPKTASVLGGPFAIVTGENPIATDIASPWSENTTTFAQLGIENHELRGSGTHSIELILRRPADWVAGNGGNLTINLQSSPAIDPLLSWIAVSVNGQDIGTTSLGPGATPTSYAFSLPAEAVNDSPGGMLRVAIDVHLQIDSDPCQATDPANAWATIAADSSWSIPHNVYTGLDLARLPAPFTSSASATPFLIALSDAPTMTDVAAALHIASAFGQRTGQQETGYPRLVRAGEITEAERGSSSIVVLGGAETNSLAASLESEDALPAVVSQSGTDGVIRMGLIDSPWFGDGTVLTIVPDSGTDASAVSNLFSSEGTLADLAGTSAIVDPNLLPQVTGLAEVPIQPPDATPTTEEAGFSVPSPEPTPTEASAVVPSLPEEGEEDDDVDEEDPLDDWQLVGSILIGGFVIAIGSFLWVRSSRGPVSRK
jgi:hypothetical protein